MTEYTIRQNSKRRREGAGRLLRCCFAADSLPSWLVGGGVLAILCFTLGDPGLTWDEPPGIERQHAMHNWLGKLLGRSETRAEAYTSDGRAVPCDCRACAAAVRSTARPFDRAGVEFGWPFARQAPDEHPPVYAILSYCTWRSTQHLWGPLRAHRLATAIMFAVTAGVMFYVVRHRWGLLAALTAIAALVCNPRLFSHAHLATTDVIMGSFWFLAAAAFLHSTETGRHGWLFGVLAGLALMSKITGGLVLAPLVVWSVLHRRRHAARALLIALLVIPVAMIVVHPGWWPVLSDPFRPFAGVARWYEALVHHDQRVPVFFLGRVYDYRNTFLPWYNAVFLMATAIPLSLLMGALVGSVGAVRNVGGAIRNLRFQISNLRFEISDLRFRRADVDAGGQETANVDSGLRTSRSAHGSPRSAMVALRCAHGSARYSCAGLATWALLNLLTLVLLRTFTSMPGHDGLRQMLPALPFFAVLVGYGVYVVRRRSNTAVAVSVCALAVLPAAYQTARTHPYQMAYYNSLMGGTRGAQRLGMESTYYWDSATSEVVDWLNGRLPRGATLVIAPPPDVRCFDWLQRWGQLRGDLDLVQYDEWFGAGRPADVYVILQSREGLIYTYPGLSGYARTVGAYDLIPRGINVRVLAVFEPPQKIVP
jgi:hypothetical protein